MKGNSTDLLEVPPLSDAWLSDGPEPLVQAIRKPLSDRLTIPIPSATAQLPRMT